MAKRFKNFRNNESNYEDEWGNTDEFRQIEKQRGKRRKKIRKTKHEEKFQNFKDFNQRV